MPQGCVLCFASTGPGPRDVVAWHQRMKSGVCCPSPRRCFGFPCTQWGKLLPPASVIAVNPLIYLHLKLDFLQLVRLLLNMASFSFLKINHNFKKLWIVANKENCRGLFVAVIATAGVTITSNFKSPLVL